MKNIDLIKGLSIHKSIVLPNMLVLQLKGKVFDEKAQYCLVFKDCIYVEDLRIGNLKIEDFSIQKRLGMKHIFLSQDLKSDFNQYSLFSIFDSNTEIKISTGEKKQVVFEVVFKEFVISDDTFYYKKIIQESG